MIKVKIDTTFLYLREYCAGNGHSHSVTKILKLRLDQPNNGFTVARSKYLIFYQMFSFNQIKRKRGHKRLREPTTKVPKNRPRRHETRVMCTRATYKYVLDIVHCVQVCHL